MPNIAIRNMLLAVFLFSTMSLFVKLVPRIPAIEVVFFRACISLGLSAWVLWRKKVPMLGNNKPVLLLRGAAGSVALILFFITLQEIPFASAVILTFTGPIFTSIIGVFMVKERLYGLQWVFFLLAFAGVFVIEGLDVRLTPYYLVLGLTASFFMGLAYNAVRKLKTSEHPLVIVFYFPLVVLPVAGTWSALNWVMPQGIEWLYLVLVGLLTQFGQYFLTKAMQAEELSVVSSLMYLQIVFALLFGFLIFNESFSVEVYAGMAMVVLGVLANIRYKFWRDRRRKAGNG